MQAPRLKSSIFLGWPFPALEVRTKLYYTVTDLSTGGPAFKTTSRSDFQSWAGLPFPAQEFRGERFRESGGRSSTLARRAQEKERGKREEGKKKEEEKKKKEEEEKRKEKE